MPIKRRNDRRRLSRVGKIHLGVKSDKGVPRAVDYFVVKPDASTSEEANAAFKAVYGDEPRELSIMFPTDDPQQWADQWYKLYSQSFGLVCLSDDTEVLTEEGWRGPSGVRVGQRVVTMNTKDGQYSEQPIDEIISYPFEGDLLRFRTRSLDALVTPDHRVVHRGGPTNRWMVSPAIKLQRGSRWPAAGVIEKPELANVDDDLLSVLGWIISDGTVQRPSARGNHNAGNSRVLSEEERAGRAHYLSIAQSKPQYVAEIAELLSRRFGRVKCSTVRNNAGPLNRDKDALPSSRFFLGRVETDACLAWLGESVHRIPRRLLRDASPRQLGVLYASLMKGDGSKDKTHGERFYPGLEEGLADDFQELCTRMGRRSMINLRSQGDYCVQVSPPQIRSHFLKHGWETQEYRGTVWCLVVPNGTFVARRSGRVFTTGNCRGDGETAWARWDADNDGPRPAGVESGTWASHRTQGWTSREVPCAGPACPMQAEQGLCRQVMNLQFLLPDVRGIGVWQIDTGSFNSIMNIEDNVETIKAVTGGRIRGLPLKLRMSQKEVVPPGGKVKKKKVWVLDLTLPDVSLADLLATTAALPVGGAIMLPPPSEEDQADVFDPVQLIEEYEEQVSGPPFGVTAAEASAAIAVAVEASTVSVADVLGEEKTDDYKQARGAVPRSPDQPAEDVISESRNTVSAEPPDHDSSERHRVEFLNRKPESVSDLLTWAFAEFHLKPPQVDEILKCEATKLQANEWQRAWVTVVNHVLGSQVPFA